MQIIGPTIIRRRTYIAKKQFDYFRHVCNLWLFYQDFYRDLIRLFPENNLNVFRKLGTNPLSTQRQNNICTAEKRNQRPLLGDWHESTGPTTTTQQCHQKKERSRGQFKL